MSLICATYIIAHSTRPSLRISRELAFTIEASPSLLTFTGKKSRVGGAEMFSSKLGCYHTLAAAEHFCHEGGNVRGLVRCLAAPSCTCTVLTA